MIKQEINHESQKIPLVSSPFIWIGVGVFLWLCILGFGYIFEIVLKDLFIISNLNHHVIYLGSNLGRLFILVVFVFIVLNKFERMLIQKKRPDLFIFKATIISFIISQAIQFLYTFYFYQNVSADFWTNSINYYNSLNAVDYYQSLLDIVFSILLYVIVGMLIYRKRACISN